MIKRGLVVVSISAAFATGAFAAACSSSSSPSNTQNTNDAGTSTGTDGSTQTTDAGTTKDSGADAGPSCASCTAAKNNCNVYPSAASSCVYATGSGFCLTDVPECFDSTTGDCDEFQFSCRSKSDCSGATAACCALNVPQGVCMGQLPETNPITQCAASCTGGSQVCATDADCAATGLRCVPMTATSGSGLSLTIGVCGS